MLGRLLWLLFALLVVGAPLHATGAQARGQIFEVDLARGVTPPAVQFVRRAIREATAADATALLIVVRSGAGVVEPAWSLARDLEAAEVPVVVWFGP